MYTKTPLSRQADRQTDTLRQISNCTTYNPVSYKATELNNRQLLPVTPSLSPIRRHWLAMNSLSLCLVCDGSQMAGVRETSEMSCSMSIFKVSNTRTREHGSFAAAPREEGNCLASSRSHPHQLALLPAPPRRAMIKWLYQNTTRGSKAIKVREYAWK